MQFEFTEVLLFNLFNLVKAAVSRGVLLLEQHIFTVNAVYSKYRNIKIQIFANILVLKIVMSK